MQGNDEVFPLKNFIDFFRQFPWSKDDDGVSRRPPLRARETSEASESIPRLLQGVNQGLHSSYEIFGPLAAGLIYLCSPLVIYIIAALLIMTTLLCFYKQRTMTIYNSKAI